jgi:predicted DNA-binding transcriptional regulator AlpA
MKNQIVLQETGFIRLRDVLKLIPVGKTSWWEGVRTGRYPQSVKLGPRTTAWRVEDIRALIEKPSANKNINLASDVKDSTQNEQKEFFKEKGLPMDLDAGSPSNVTINLSNQGIYTMPKSNTQRRNYHPSSSRILGGASPKGTPTLEANPFHCKKPWDGPPTSDPALSFRPEPGSPWEKVALSLKGKLGDDIFRSWITKLTTHQFSRLIREGGIEC